jgi:L-serine dehydratase
MVGPSSSHTAGACKLGYMARHIFGILPKKITLQLHGSFGEVYEGHCTDTALIAGLLGMIPSDENIVHAREYAEKEGIKVSLQPVSLGNQYHPNTVRFILKNGNNIRTITGSSLGGGSVVITEIDKIEILLNGSFSSLLIQYDNTIFSLKSLLELVSTIPCDVIRTETRDYKNRSLFHAEIRESEINSAILDNIQKQKGVQWASFVPHISHYRF